MAGLMESTLDEVAAALRTPHWQPREPTTEDKIRPSPIEEVLANIKCEAHKTCKAVSSTKTRKNLVLRTMVGNATSNFTTPELVGASLEDRHRGIFWKITPKRCWFIVIASMKVFHGQCTHIQGTLRHTWMS